MDYLRASDSSVTITEPVSPLKGLVASSSVDGTPAGSISPPFKRRSRNRSGGRQEFSGYLENRPSHSKENPPLIVGTERTKLKEAVRRSLEDSGAVEGVTVMTPELPSNHAAV